MSTGMLSGQTGYYHEALRYGSDEELLDVVVPFLLGGVAAREPTIAALCEPNAALVREALGDDTPVVFQSGGDTYARPAAAIRAYTDVFAGYAADGARQIRVVGELPPEVLGATWDWWARYESAINEVYAEFPLWTVCAYDERTASPEVLADVARTHPHVTRPGDTHLPSAEYVEPGRFLRHDLPPAPDPLQHTPPAVELVNPVPAQARSVLAGVIDGVLTTDALNDLRIAVTETVTNAMTHGRAPIVVRYWPGPDRVVVTVTDRGTGPSDPFAGLRAAAHAPTGGLGLWLTHQLCDHVSMNADAEGFTVRMISGNPNHRA
ncbi:anti-sigma factor RsbA family regulatory protein [Actinophytocola sp. NPDC049390]|uniref:anti-sigma factor RsbA family regulatory protein n=1 Tax=Actinophytocola sp. NPDC049390 TaxID=3363894 RepID=UPI0037A8B307